MAAPRLEDLAKSLVSRASSNAEIGRSAIPPDLVLLSGQPLLALRFLPRTMTDAEMSPFAS